MKPTITVCSLAIVLLSLGCQMQQHVQRLDTLSDSDAGRRITSARALARYHGEAVTNALINALSDDDAAVRFFASESIASSGICCERQFDLAVQRLVNLLDDRSRGRYSTKSWGTYVENTTGSVRARALLTLTILTHADYGFEKASWKDWLTSRQRSAGTGEAGTSSTANR